MNALATQRVKSYRVYIFFFSPCCFQINIITGSIEFRGKILLTNPSQFVVEYFNLKIHESNCKSIKFIYIL